MMNKLSYPGKCLALALGFLFSLIAAYKLSFAKTIALKSEIAEKEKKISWMKEKEKEIPALKAKMALVGKACKDGDSSSVRDRLTAFISDFSENNHCIVTEIPLSRTYHHAQLSVETNVFTIKGDFKVLLQMEQALEKEFGMAAKIMSARFFCIKDMQSKRKNLYLTVTTQSFKQSGSKT